jgi:hypothetical protein
MAALKEEVPFLAPESSKIKKAREKLILKLEVEKKWITPELIRSTKEKISQEYHRNMHERLQLPPEEKPLRLFAQGEGVKIKASARVGAVMERVLREFDEQKQKVEKR